MSVRGLSGYTLSWVQQSAQMKPQRDTFAEGKARESSNDIKIIEQEAKSQEFSKDELTRLRDFMASVGKDVESMDGILRNFDRIDTKGTGKITAEQVKEFESSTADAVVPAQPIMLDNEEVLAPMAKAPMESYLNKYTATTQQKTSTFERSE